MPPKTSFLDPIITLEKKKQLGPGTYKKHENWADDLKSRTSHGHPRKGQFNPRERPLVTVEFMKEAKLRNIPPPGAYDPKVKEKALLCHTSTSAKSSYHIDNAIYKSKQTPTVCYKTVDNLIGPTKPRSLITKIYEPTTKKEDLMKKPKKDPLPDMGSYESKRGFEYTRDRSYPSQKWSPSPVVKFYEPQIKRSKQVPSCSHYTVTDKALSKITKSPPSLRIRRH